ncbi:hypothetical protein NPIL_155791 [Nephila pilipes]|uniref:Uncharacterized protein n=1 Tax=Nephila pilipes TaxID=299642 RepID=A0A8X6INX9_NEPPI|nr:hypothetical protein NPIL_155791 [Nephila pilipes]
MYSYLTIPNEAFTEARASNYSSSTSRQLMNWETKPEADKRMTPFILLMHSYLHKWAYDSRDNFVLVPETKEKVRKRNVRNAS